MALDSVGQIQFVSIIEERYGLKIDFKQSAAEIKTGDGVIIVGVTGSLGVFMAQWAGFFDAEIRGSWGCLPEHYPFILERVPAGDLVLASLVETRPMSCITSTFEELRFKGNPGKRVVLIPDF